jgi:hypothetical protein
MGQGLTGEDGHLLSRDELHVRSAPTLEISKAIAHLWYSGRGIFQQRKHHATYFSVVLIAACFKSSQVFNPHNSKSSQRMQAKTVCVRAGR